MRWACSASRSPTCSNSQVSTLPINMSKWFTTWPSISAAGTWAASQVPSESRTERHVVDAALSQRAGVHRRSAVQAERDASEDEARVLGGAAALARLQRN